jgi:hypothetical protein
MVEEEHAYPRAETHKQDSHGSRDVIHLRIDAEGDLPGEFWLSEEQWERLRPLLPNKPRGVPRVDDRRVIGGIVHVLQAGCRWKDASSAYGPYKTLYNRHKRWSERACGRQCSKLSSLPPDHRPRS